MKIVGIRPVLLQATYEAGSELRWAGGRIESWDAALVEIGNARPQRRHQKLIEEAVGY